jgi:hypothetical protein
MCYPKETKYFTQVEVRGCEGELERKINRYRYPVRISFPLFDINESQKCLRSSNTGVPGKVFN